MVSQGRSTRYLLPGYGRAHIRKNNLYRKENFRIDIKPLSPKRFTHCLGVAKCLYDSVAMLWEGDPMKAYRRALSTILPENCQKSSSYHLAREHDYPIDQATLDAPIPDPWCG